jgi:dissimilatory sulfite reductase (desulfoviridin) alpha/beta subunit
MADNSTKIYVGTRFVGEVQTGKFKKRIEFSRHALRTPPALALSVESLRQAENFGACEIEITDKESARVFACTIEHFKRYSWELHRGGFEPQRAMALERWTLVKGGRIKSSGGKSGASAVTKEPIYSNVNLKNTGPVQMGLWTR